MALNNLKEKTCFLSLLSLSIRALVKMSNPCHAFVSFLLRVLYRDLLATDDTFLIQLRKMFIVIQAPLSVISLWLLISLFTESRQTQIYVPGAAIRHIVVILTQLCSWGYVRATRSVPDWVVVILCNIVSVVLILNSLTITNGPNHFLYAVIIIFVAISNIRHTYLNMIVPGIGLVIHAYNASLGRTGGPYKVLGFPDAADRPPNELVLGYAFQLVILAARVARLQALECARSMGGGRYVTRRF